MNEMVDSLKVEKDFETEFVFSKTLMHINNSFNILFLMLFGKSLRKDLKKIFFNFKIRKSR